MSVTKKTVTIIPAGPGWFVVFPVYGAENIVKSFYEEYIIGWAVTAYIRDEYHYLQIVSPITHEGSVEDDVLYLIRRPNRSLTASSDRDIEESEAISFLQAESDRLRLANEKRSKVLMNSPDAEPPK